MKIENASSDDLSQLRQKATAPMTVVEVTDEHLAAKFGVTVDEFRRGMDILTATPVERGLNLKFVPEDKPNA